jgi:hypothetical protein
VLLRLREALEPIRLRENEPDILLLLEVVVDGDRDRHLVTARERDRKIEVHEEVLEDAQVAFAASERAALRVGRARHPPVGDAVRHLQLDRRLAVPIRDE